VQGNVDPAALFGSKELIRDRIPRHHQEAGNRGHILNLGHGILPGTPEENAAYFFETASPLPKRIFITGASGCIGHYLIEALLDTTPHELFLLLRNPAKLQFNWQDKPRLHVIPRGHPPHSGPWGLTQDHGHGGAGGHFLGGHRRDF
jgi:hypothetical protein